MFLTAHKPKTSFFSNMSHEINTAMNVILKKAETTPVKEETSTKRKSHDCGDNKELISSKALDKIRSLQIKGAPDILTRIIGLYLRDTPLRLNQLYQALQANDAAEVRSVAHNLKSSCANLGAVYLSTLFKEIEHKGHTNSLQGTAQLFAKAVREFQKIIKPLRAEIVNS